MTTPTAELRPCPLCSGSDLRVENLVVEAVIQCRDCKCNVYGKHSHTEDGMALAIQRWNRRADDLDALRAENAALRRVAEAAESEERFLASGEYSQVDHFQAKKMAALSAWRAMGIQSTNKPKE